ncbi:MAG: CRTAC1 family protein [Pedosphaera sp.]|nr:CRTAC1 family protein [Pedosphaera sp.]
MGDDDGVIAQALWRSVAALLVLGFLAGAAVWWFSRQSSSTKTQVTDLAVPKLAAALNGTFPQVNFRNITREAGITFTHVNGARGDKLLPETMGGGVAFSDVDNDGDQDLIFVSGTAWPGTPALPGIRPATSALFLNDGGGVFRDGTVGSGLDISFFGMGVACGDYDNDGLVDLVFTGVGGNHLFHNLGNAHFREVTAEAGLGGRVGDWSTAAAWVDIDNDGDLDLFIGNYIQWSPELDREVDNRLVGVGRAYGRPWNFPGSFPHLYRNDGGGRFVDVTARSGLQVKNPASGTPAAKTLAVAPIDLNNDGWIDLVVANDTVQNFVFTNRHDGTFREIGAQSGMAFDAYGQTRGAMGIDAARFRNDAAVGIAIGNFANEMNALYVSQGDQLLFADEAITSGLGPASRLFLKFGLFFFDYDLDGRLDVLTANGHIDADIEKVQANVRYRQPAQLFWNAGGNQTFIPVDAAGAGADLFEPMVGRGSAFADIDGDGDLDVILTQINSPPRLLRNEQNLGAKWVRFKLKGRHSNRDAIGAWIRVRLGGQWISRQVMPTRSYLSQSELPVTIGLGKNGTVDEVLIVWPGGHTQRVEGVAPGAVSEVVEAE